MKQPRNKGKFVKTSASYVAKHAADLDHNYAHICLTEPAIKLEVTDQPHNSNIGIKWNEGRRIIELGLLAEQLDKGCVHCGALLRLSHCKQEERYGMGSILYIACYHCWKYNTVTTGKRHTALGKKSTNPAWDVNTKLATAMINTGLGETQLNTLLAGINLPMISSASLKKHENEAGLAFESVAKKACDQAIKQEKELLNGSTPGVAQDGAWQKRGSMKSYNSLSGHLSSIGLKSRKVLDWQVCAKRCRYCSLGKRLGRKLKHSCRRNWTGSAKAMEPHMAIQSLKHLKDKGLDIKQIVGDADTTTEARVKKAFNGEITKSLDKNHVLKNFGNALYGIKKEHKMFSATAIGYLQKCVRYAIAKSATKEELKVNLSAIVPHAFDDHQLCPGTWCTSVVNPSIPHVYKSLPGGKPLQNMSLRDSLSKLLQEFSQPQMIDKLLHLNSTQSNENFNQMVARKAPKAVHYSDSGSLHYRVAATVVQKNEGHTSMTKVVEEMALSPGRFTEKRAEMLDKKKAANIKYAESIPGKRSRIQNKENRNLSEATNQVYEGTTYSTGVAGTQQAEVIDEILLPPLLQDPDKPRIIGGPCFFDVETTGLSIDDEIIQIAALQKKDDIFNRYVWPERGSIPSKISKITGIEIHGNKMFSNSLEVVHTSLQQALKELFDKYPGSVFHAHNAQFDARMLIAACQHLNIDVHSKGISFCDTLPMLKQAFPGQKSYRQEHLVQNIVGQSYEAHNAAADVCALHDLYQVVPESIRCNEKFFFTTHSVAKSILLLENKKRYFTGYHALIDKKVLSEYMANKLSRGGISIDVMKRVANDQGVDGLYALLLPFTKKKVIAMALYNELCNQ